MVRVRLVADFALFRLVPKLVFPVLSRSQTHFSERARSNEEVEADGLEEPPAESGRMPDFQELLEL